MSEREHRESNRRRPGGRRWDTYLVPEQIEALMDKLQQTDQRAALHAQLNALTPGSKEYLRIQSQLNNLR